MKKRFYFKLYDYDINHGVNVQKININYISATGSNKAEALKKIDKAGFMQGYQELKSIDLLD